MKIKFLAILVSIIFFLILLGIFFIDIPSPSKKMIEEYKIEVL